MSKLLKALLCTAVISIVAFIWILFNNDKNFEIIIYAGSIILASLIWLVIYLSKGEEYEHNLINAIGFGLVILGWFVNSYINNLSSDKQNILTNENAVKNAQREIKVKYLLDAYLRMESVSRRDSEPFVGRFLYLKNVEAAVGTVSLFGDSPLVRKINSYALKGFGKDSTEFSSAIYQLRTDLRKELGLDSLPNQVDNINSSYNIYSYRYWILDSMRKTNPEFYQKLELDFTKESINRNFSH